MLKMELRNNELHVEGYVNTVCRESRTLRGSKGYFNEVVEAGAWTKALENAHNVDLLFNHMENRNLGSTKAGNLELFEDSIGLRAKTVINDPEVIQKAKDGLLKGWSFKFSVNPNGDEWRTLEDKQIRYLKDFKLYEVSILDITPAYIGTSIESRYNESEVIELRANTEDFKLEIEETEPESINLYKDNKKLKIEVKRLRFNYKN